MFPNPSMMPKPHDSAGTLGRAWRRIGMVAGFDSQSNYNYNIMPYSITRVE